MFFKDAMTTSYIIHINEYLKTSAKSSRFMAFAAEAAQWAF
jgi:hypothetical protein